MYFTRIVLSIVFVLFASAALAAKPDKTLVCHVGSQLGSMDETYQDNHDCTIAPEWIGDPADYICPDAGKVDLILVSPKAKHIGNSAHSFLDAENYLWEDYSPEEGVGDEAADFEEGDVTGIDRGCELDEPASCPCWSSIPVDRYCDFDEGGPYWSINSEDGAAQTYSYLVNYKAGIPAQTIYCSLSGSTVPNNYHALLDGDTHSETEFAQCVRDIQAICDTP